jgi:hypothetical protein
LSEPPFVGINKLYRINSQYIYPGRNDDDKKLLAVNPLNPENPPNGGSDKYRKEGAKLFNLFYKRFTPEVDPGWHFSAVINCYDVK